MNLIKLGVVLFASLLMLSMSAHAKDRHQSEKLLKAKIGQMIMMGFDGALLKASDSIAKAIQRGEVGGVILFDYQTSTNTYDNNIKNPEQLKRLTTQLQNYAKHGAIKRKVTYYPLLISIDYEGGKVNRLKERYGFPATITAEAFAKLSDEAATKQAEVMAQTLEDMGINLDYAPVIDVNINPESPAIGKYGRSFSADPDVVVRSARIFTRALRAHGILCSYKHFPGHGSATGDTHKGFVDVTETWQPSELKPYQTLLADPDNCGMVMVAHVKHYGLDGKGHAASLSKPIIHDLLRGQLNFDGVVITDDLQMKAITEVYGTREAIRLTINAGTDILMFGNQLSAHRTPSQIVNMIYKDVKSGKISEKRINEAYQRIIELKKRIGHEVLVD